MVYRVLGFTNPMSPNLKHLKLSSPNAPPNSPRSLDVVFLELFLMSCPALRKVR